jgi:hypothetical protein
VERARLDNDAGLLAYLCATVIGRKLADPDSGRRGLCARVPVGSSGAALQGLPLSGGYAGAKRTLWLLARYANGVAEKGLGIRFQASSAEEPAAIGPGCVPLAPICGSLLFALAWTDASVFA